MKTQNISIAAFLPRLMLAWGFLAFVQFANAEDPIRVLVWDEQQPAQKEAYDNFLGNEIAKHLGTKTDLMVRSSSINDGEQGLSPALLDYAQVIVWWGHVRHPEIKSELGKDIVRRVQKGQCNLVAIHSAHWSTPFMEAMNEVSRIRLKEEFARKGIDKLEIQEVVADRFKAPNRDQRKTPFWELDSEKGTIQLHLPNCCFPAYRNDGKPSQLEVLKPEHPLAKNLPKSFRLARTEMYDEPFHVPDPDETIVEEHWEAGERFRSVMLWRLGAGSIIYIRPGHETYPIYKDPNMLQLIDNAVYFDRVR